MIIRIKIIVLLVGCTFLSFAQLKIVSWNIQDFGLKKSRFIPSMAALLDDADLVLIQEVQVDQDGIGAIENLVNELASKGVRWGYTISEPTNGKGRERYAYLWKADVCLIKGNAWLEKSLDEVIDR